MLDANAYLARIAYHGSTAETAETLRAIHRAHLLAVPFENLDIPRRKIVLEPEAFLKKIVEKGRGGFCYELNGAFAELLRALGFSVTLLSARVAHQTGVGPEFDHLVLRVDLGEPWLADVGFGELFLEPLRLKPGIEQRDGPRAFRIAENSENLALEHRERGNEWRIDYLFTLQPRRLEEFEGMCHYHQTSPNSHFTQKRICSLATDTGRITLSDLRFSATHDGTREERVLSSEQEWREALKQYFGVVLEW